MDKAESKQSEFSVLTAEGEEIKTHPITVAIELFLHRLNDLQQAAFVSEPAVIEWHKKEVEKQHNILSKHFVQGDGESNSSKIVTGAHGASEILKAVMELNRLHKSKISTTLLRSLYCGIFSEYDVFTGNLLRALYELKPDLFRNIKREIALDYILEFDSVLSLKQDILSKEIENFRRNSYIEQFSELEGRFDLKLKDFTEWPKFVEFGQRRNLLTHNGGVCSEQYLTLCEKAGYRIAPRSTVGEQLEVTMDYFNDAIATISKVAFMLGHTLWRKIRPDESPTADTDFNLTVFKLLLDENWNLAAELGKFGLAQPIIKKTKDREVRMRIVNTAIALKFSNRMGEASSLLECSDWSASLREFHLAIHVLRDEYIKAAEIMRSIGKKGELISRMAYHDWPLFLEFRDTVEFQTTYKDIYGVPFIEELANEVSEKSSEGATEKRVRRTRKSVEVVKSDEDSPKATPTRQKVKSKTSIKLKSIPK